MTDVTNEERMIREGWLFRCLKCGCVGDWVCSCDGGTPTTEPITAEEEIAAAHEMLNELGVITHIGPDQGNAGPVTKLNVPQRLRLIARPLRWAEGSRMTSKPNTYRGFRIDYDPPPIPSRNCDWHWVHEDFDGDEDNRYGHAESEEAAKAAVDFWHEENGQ